MLRLHLISCVNEKVTKLLKFKNIISLKRKMSSNNFKGVDFEKVYRNSEKWELDHLPPIVNKRDHIVLFQLPIEKNATQPPVPHRGEIKWDANHVKLPYAKQNEYKTDSSVKENLKKKKYFQLLLLYKILNIDSYMFYFRAIQQKPLQPHDGKSLKQHYYEKLARVEIWKQQF